MNGKLKKMIKVKLTTYDYSPLIRENFLKQTPNLSGEWENFKFYLNEKIDTCDYWVVFDYLPKEDSTYCPKENTLFITGEPSAIKKYNEKFLSQFSKIITCQRKIKHPHVYYTTSGHAWRSKKSYDELYGHGNVEKNKLICIVVSNKSGTPGHKKRLDFCLNLKKHFGDKIDIFGRGINDFDDKWDVLAPYKYSIAIENSVERDYMTEKIGDCFISLTFPFYYGCPNIDKYYNKDSYQLIDIDDFEKSCDIIEKIIYDNDHYNQHFKSLVESKNKYLNQYSMIPLIVNFIKSEYEKTISSKEKRIEIKPEKEFQKKMCLVNHIKRIPRRMSRALKTLRDRFSLSDKGERIDINYNKVKNFKGFDIYQKNHYARYRHAKEFLNQDDIVGDFACGTGYGTSMLSERVSRVIGVDINEKVIKTIKKRYEDNKKIKFVASNILDIKYRDYFDKIISFETIEHLEEKDIILAFKLFFGALKPEGKIIFSAPYMQEKSDVAIKMGFHKTFYINEEKIKNWLEQTGFKSFSFMYQNYKTHEILGRLADKDFIICIASK